MRLYGATPSPFFRKCVVVLAEKGIPYETAHLVSVPKTPELLAMHPMGKIPILRDGDLVVPDSSVICAYLEKKHPAPALYPDDPAALARALFLEEYADTQMASVLGTVLFERFIKPRFLQQACDETLVAKLLERELPPVMAYLEGEVPESGDSVLPHFSIADAALGAQLGNLSFSGVALDARRWPRTAAYQEALLARPSVKTAMAQ